jgi:hypothetical protein
MVREVDETVYPAEPTDERDLTRADKGRLKGSGSGGDVIALTNRR